jgi:hypothetical protein
MNRAMDILNRVEGITEVKMDKTYSPTEYVKRAKEKYDYEVKMAKKADAFMKQIENDLHIKGMAYKRSGNAAFVYVEIDKYDTWDRDDLQKKYNAYVDMVDSAWGSDKDYLPSFKKFNLRFRLKEV